MAVTINTIVSGGGSGGGGSSTYAGLSDASTVNLPTVNTPLSNALALKADGIVITSITTSTFNVTHASNLGNHVNKTNIATTGTFAATGTSGAVDGDVFELDIGASGSFTATGAITAAPGFTLTAPAKTVFTAVYNAAADAFYSTTPIATTSKVFVLPAPVSLTGTLTQTTLATYTIPANTFQAGSMARWSFLYTKTGTAGTHEYALTFGGTLIGDKGGAGSATDKQWLSHGDMFCYGTSNQVVSQNFGFQVYEGNNTITPSFTTINTTSAQDYVFKMTLGNVADTITLQSLILEIVNPQ